MQFRNLINKIKKNIFWKLFKFSWKNKFQLKIIFYLIKCHEKEIFKYDDKNQLRYLIFKLIKCIKFKK